MLSQAVILAGGRGTRLGALAETVPKPLLEVAGRPFLDYLLWNLKRSGLRRVLFLLGYRAEQATAHLGDGHRYGMSFSYSVETKPLGTGGGLRAALDQLDECFLLLNGDTLFDINYWDLAASLTHGTLASVGLRAVADASRYARVVLRGERVTLVAEKAAAGPGLINGGVYAFRRSAVAQLAEGPSSLEQKLLPDLAAAGQLGGRRYRGFFLDIGVPTSFAAAQRQLPSWQVKPAVLFDRDGVLNVDRGYVHSSNTFSWTPGAVQAIKWLNDRGYLVLVVTNQAGIARGYYSERRFERLCTWMNLQLRACGAHIDAFYYCPHHPTDGIGSYRRSCDCRKPQPGLVVRALDEWQVDRSRSVLIGDQLWDLQAAQAAGLRGVRYRAGDLLTLVKRVMLNRPPGASDALSLGYRERGV